MGRIIKRIAAGLLGLIVLAVLVVYGVSSYRLGRDYEGFEIQVAAVPIPTDSEAVERGRHIAVTRYCGFCHGESLAGGFLLDEPIVARVPAPNLTPGAGGVGATNTDADWIRAVRHGVGSDGRGLVGMPARLWSELSDADLGDLIAYLKSLPAVDNELPERSFGPLFRLLLVLGDAPQSEAAVIDHAAPRPESPPPAVTVEYGAYLAAVCSGCHGPELNGGIIRDLDGNLLPAANLTPGGELAGWSEADFIGTLRTGVTPTGQELNPGMPWQYVGQMTDAELKAIWLFFQSLPPLEQGTERTDL